VAEDRERWRALVNTVMNLRVPWNVENFLSSWRLIFSGRTVLHRVRFFLSHTKLRRLNTLMGRSAVFLNVEQVVRMITAGVWTVNCTDLWGVHMHAICSLDTSQQNYQVHCMHYTWKLDSTSHWHGLIFRRVGKTAKSDY
jgi:hypothetical protein